jgi:Na+/melibiose symporter-like transporter
MLGNNAMKTNRTTAQSKTEKYGTGDYLKITILGFALTALWSSIHSIILPLRLLDFVPEAQKNTYLDLLILTGLVLALIVQPIAGALSDVCSLRWGRRRPYILAGTLILIILTAGIGLSQSYVAIFIVYCLMQISSNTVQGPYQAFIPEMVPEGKRGRASGVKGLLSIIGGVALIRLIAVLINRYPANTGLWLSLVILGSIVIVTLLVTIFTIKEKPWKGEFTSPFTPIRQSFNVDLKAKPQFILFLVASFLVFTGWNTLSAHALYYFQDVVGIANPVTVTADLVIAMGIGMIVIVYLAGLLSDKIGRRPVVVGSGFIGALGIIVLFFSKSYLQVMVSGTLLGMCAGAWLSSQWALATDLVGKGEEAKYLGIANMSIAGAGAAARLIGPLIDTLNANRAGFGYQIMLLACFIYFIAGSIMLMRVKISPH